MTRARYMTRAQHNVEVVAVRVGPELLPQPHDI